jgi:(R,R)-butanediol dehydrogenase / meso-butanediol dehydrogenase / diacetyl reductase
MDAAFYQGNNRITIGPASIASPATGQVRLEVAFCGLCGTDLHIYQGHMDKRVVLPHIPGHEMSGLIAEVGPGVDSLIPGDRVVVRPLDPCGTCPACAAGHGHICHNLRFLGIDSPGALQGSWTVPAATVHVIPDAVPLDCAALIEPLVVAVHAVRRGEATCGQRAVVMGAGPIGLLTGLVLRDVGVDVLLADINGARRRIAGGLGFETLDPGQRNWEARVEHWTGGAGADLVFEASGSAAGAAAMAALARTRGCVVIVGIFAELTPVDLYRVFWREIDIRGARVYQREDFDHAIALAADGRVPLEPLISARPPLGEVAEHMVKLLKGGDMMKVLVRPEGN